MEKKYTLHNLAHTALVAGAVVGYLMTKFQDLGFQVGDFNARRGTELPYEIEMTFPKQGFAICIRYDAKEQISAMGMNTLSEQELAELDPYQQGCRWKADTIMAEVNALTGGKMIERAT